MSAKSGVDDMSETQIKDSCVKGIRVGEKALITTDNWFWAPDGRQYNGVFGTIKGIKTAEATLGIKPNGKSANWYLEIGNMVIAGCQIHYAVRACTCCEDELLPSWKFTPETGYKKYMLPRPIYFADIES